MIRLISSSVRRFLRSACLGSRSISPFARVRMNSRIVWSDILRTSLPTRLGAFIEDLPSPLLPWHGAHFARYRPAPASTAEADAGERRRLRKIQTVAVPACPFISLCWAPVRLGGSVRPWPRPFRIHGSSYLGLTGFTGFEWASSFVYNPSTAEIAHDAFRPLRTLNCKAVRSAQHNGENRGKGRSLTPCPDYRSANASQPIVTWVLDSTARFAAN